MTNQELDFRPHFALLYPLVGKDGKGNPVVSATPTELNPQRGTGVRWEQVRRQVAGPQGTPIAITAQVTVDREIAIGSIMWRGGLHDLTGTGDAPTVNLMEVVSFDDVPDLKDQGHYREVGLARWNSTELPLGDDDD